uniref:BPI1 domain-containing protein n=1 Tax=Strongyloides venezuelensis TaxID=75913 RepID=A0A0K0EVP9_STRVS
MAGVAIDYLNSIISKVNIPDIERFFKFTYHLSEIKIEIFNIPKFLNGISGLMSAHYQVKIKEGFIHVSKSRTVDVTIRRTSIDAFVGISSLNVNPNIWIDIKR